MIGRSDTPRARVTGTFTQTGERRRRHPVDGRQQPPAPTPSRHPDVGGSFTATTFTISQGATSSTSTINIGGTADVTLPAFPTARGAGTTATINFDGGTLKPKAASATYMGGLTNAFIKAGGASFDTTGFDITVTQDLLTDVVSTGGGLTKAGSNTLTLNGTNTYTGYHHRQRRCPVRHP